MLNRPISELEVINPLYSSNIQKIIPRKMFSFQSKDLPFGNSTKQSIKFNSLHTNLFIQRQKIAQSSLLYSWKPKIKSKRLSQEQKFLISLEKKKIRFLKGICMRQIKIQTHMSTRPKCFQGEKIKQSQYFKHKSYVDSKYEEIPLENIQEKKIDSRIKIQKNPHINFNIHHIIKKRRDYKASQPRITGSNLPYYQYYFDSEKNIKSQQNNKLLRPSKTADSLIFEI